MSPALPCSHLLHLAAIVIERAPVIIDGPQVVSVSTGGSDLMSCWSALHDRQRAWAKRVVMTDAPMMADDPELSRFVVEMFLSEPLSRLWASIVACQQDRHGLNAMSSIYRTTLEREDELRQRAVGPVLAGRSMSLETSLQLHRMRRYAHRATQLLVESLASRYAVAESFRIDCNTMSPRRERPQPHWWSTATRAATPLRLLAQSLATGSISGDARCSHESMQVVQCVLKCLPPMTLHGSDVHVGPAQLAHANGGEASHCLPWSQDPTRQATEFDVAARRR